MNPENKVAQYIDAIPDNLRLDGVKCTLANEIGQATADAIS